MDMTEKLVAATPVERLESGLKAVVELTVYPKGHTAIGVSTVEGGRGERTIRQADNMALNDTNELKTVVGAIIDRLERET